MCGIFGVLRAGIVGSDPALDQSVAAAFALLGRRSVSRGKDSAGFAAVGSVLPATVHLPNPSDHSASKVDIDGTTIVRGLGRFESVYNPKAHTPVLASAVAILGHTRAATQGSRTVLNASPLMAGTLVGTHNGDVTADTVPGHGDLKPVPQTDSALIYEALDRAAGDRDSIVSILTAVRGRAALAWVDRVNPNRVYLARAALSPLVTARDEAGNLWWASVPSWFTDGEAAAFGFHDIQFVPEGTLLVIDRDGNNVPQIIDTREFIPTARSTDERLGMFVWRDFTDKDKAFDQSLLRHAVVTVPDKKAATTSPYPTAAKVSYREAVEMAQAVKAMKRTPQGTVDAQALVTAILAPKPASKAVTTAGPDYEYVTVDKTRTVPRAKTVVYESTWDQYGDDEFDADDLFDADEKAAIALDEAQEAYLNWVERGCPTAVVDLIQALKTKEDAAAIAEEFSFTFDESSWELRELINCHDEHMQEFADEFAVA